MPELGMDGKVVQVHADERDYEGKIVGKDRQNLEIELEPFPIESPGVARNPPKRLKDNCNLIEDGPVRIWGFARTLDQSEEPEEFDWYFYPEQTVEVSADKVTVWADD